MDQEYGHSLSELFQRALKQPPSRLDEFLRRECGSDSALCAELHEMLREHTRSGWLDQPIVESVPDARPVFYPGQVVSERYKIVRFVGRGGMGEVYEAQDRDLNERVALKTLLPAIAENAGMIARFKQEIQLARRVAHPNVCRVYDLAHDPLRGSSPRSVVFLTMEFLDGETLAASLQREGRLAQIAALPILEQIAQGLNAAHAIRIIHRDLKPSNVMLVPRAVITDFGLARNLPRSTDSTLTLEQGLVGTLDYMAPEVLISYRATIASDIYALGMLAYKTATGRLPFDDKPPLVAAILRSRVPLPPPRSFVSDLDPAWDLAILLALDPDPSRRFETALAFVRALRGETSSMKSPSSLTRRLWISGGVLAASVAVGEISWWVGARLHYQPSADATHFYQQGVDNIRAGAYFAATKALDKAIRLAPHFALAHARLAEAWNALDLTERASQEMLLARREDLSRLPPRDRLQLEAIDLNITREFEPAAVKYEQMRRYVKPDDAGFDVDMGRAYERAGQPLKAIESYSRAARGPSHDPAAWLRLAVLYSRLADSARTAEAFRQADELYQTASNLEGLTEVALQQGISADDRGHVDQATSYLRRALETAQAAGNLHQEIVAKLQLGINAYLAGDASTSERYSQEVVTIALANGMQALAARGLAGLGGSHFRKGDFTGAEKHYRDSLTLARQSGSQILEALTLLPLASLHYQLGHPDDSAREAQEALQVFQANHFARESLQCLTLLGRAQTAHGDIAGAMRSYLQALTLAESVQDHFQMALAHESMGGILSDQERYPEALREYQQNLALSTDKEHIGYAEFQCADTLWRLGRYDEAKAMYTQAEAKAQSFPLLRISILRSRAEMALSEERYSEAAALCRQVLSGPVAEPEAAVAARILGLTRIRQGAWQEGVRKCESAVSLARMIGDRSVQIPAQLTLAEAYLEGGDTSDALTILREVIPSVTDLPDSRWRTLALAAQVDRAKARAYATSARQQLDAIAMQWGSATFALYIRRQDSQRLLRPLSRQFSMMKGNYQ